MSSQIRFRCNKMHVSDDKQIINLHVYDSDGHKYDIEVSNDLNVDCFKTMCLTHFLNDPLISVKNANSFKLVSVQNKRSLNNDMNLRDEQITDGMDLVLLKSIPYKRQEEESLDSQMKRTAPNDEEIADATKSLADKNVDRISIEIPNSIDFQKELRKILVSLIEYSYDLLKTHSEVKPIFGELDLNSNQSLIANEDNEEFEAKDGMSEEVLKQLTDMGFASDRAKRALKLNNMSAVDAMDWLLANDSIFESSSSSSSLRADSETAVIESSKNSFTSATGLCPLVPTIVDRYRRFKRRQFKANPKAFKGLCDMGFDENEVMDALNVHSNNEIAACEWLLSERRPKIKDLEMGLSKDSPIYKAIVSNAVIQLGLVKPRVLFALLQLVEEPNSTGRWLSDSQMSPILSQMFRIFHSEKHAIEETFET